MLRIMIVDDHTLLTDSLSLVLERFSDISIVATAHNGQEAIEKCLAVRPDVVLIDIKMPLMDGIKASSIVRKELPDTKLIVLTSMEDGKYVTNALLSGVDGYLMKDTPPDTLKMLIDCVHRGFFVMSGSCRDILSEELSRPLEMDAPQAILDSLRDEDVEMIRCISEGKSNGEIAELFGYAMGTVKNKITRLLEITGAGNRAQLVMFALRHNLL